MDPGFIIEITFKALWMSLVLCGPVLIALLIVGLVIGILQAATSVNESSVAFIPKLLVLGDSLSAEYGLPRGSTKEEFLMRVMTGTWAGVLAALLLACTAGALAQDRPPGYPSRPIRLIVSVSAGAGSACCHGKPGKHPIDRRCAVRCAG